MVRMKSRSGDTVKLSDLLDEATERALKQLKERSESAEGEKKMQVDESKLEETAERMGIASIKYFDLKQDRI